MISYSDEYPIESLAEIELYTQYSQDIIPTIINGTVNTGVGGDN